MPSSAVPLLDTNIIVHGLANDEQTAECQRFILALQSGTLHARLEPIVLHELMYVLPRVIKQLGQGGAAAYLQTMLTWPGLEGDIAIMDDALRRWSANASLGFVDAYLAAVATRDACAVYTKNVRDFAGQGVDVPNPLPDGADG